MFDRLPTPYGLVRGGVAPDHPKIKSVTRIYDRIAAHPGFRFLGNVNDRRRHRARRAASRTTTPSSTPSARRPTGSSAFRARSSRGSHAATEFVGWYNGHPDYRDRRFDLSADAAPSSSAWATSPWTSPASWRAAWPSSPPTDLSRHALDALRASKVRSHLRARPSRAGPGRVHQPGAQGAGRTRRGRRHRRPARDRARRAQRRTSSPAARIAPRRRTSHTLREFAARKPEGRKRRIVLRFLVSPVEILGHRPRRGREAREEPPGACVGQGRSRPRPPARRRRCRPASSSARWDTRASRFPACRSTSAPASFRTSRAACSWRRAHPRSLPGVYAVGWIKRGPSGVIGTNKPDSVETADRLLEDVASGAVMPEAARRSHRGRSDAAGPRRAGRELCRLAEARRAGTGGRQAPRRPARKVHASPEMLEH